MIYSNKYIKNNFKKLNGKTEYDATKFIKAYAKFICEFEYPTEEQINYALQYDRCNHEILKEIKHFPVEFIERVMENCPKYLEYMQNIPNEYLKDVKILPQVEETNNLCNISPSGVDEKIFIDWIKQYKHKFAFTDLPKYMQTKMNLIIYIKEAYDINIKSIPYNMLTSKIISLLIKRQSSNIEIIPKDLLSYEHYKQYLLQSIKCLDSEPYGYNIHYNTEFSIPKNIANKMLFDNEISPAAWRSLEEADLNVFETILKETHNINALRFIPDNTLAELFKKNKLNWILNEESKVPVLDKYFENSLSSFKQELLHINKNNVINTEPKVIVQLIDNDELYKIPKLNVDEDDLLIGYALDRNAYNIFYIDNPTEDMIIKSIINDNSVVEAICNNKEFKINSNLDDYKLAEILIDVYKIDKLFDIISALKKVNKEFPTNKQEYIINEIKHSK